MLRTNKLVFRSSNSTLIVHLFSISQHSYPAVRKTGSYSGGIRGVPLSHRSQGSVKLSKESASITSLCQIPGSWLPPTGGTCTAPHRLRSWADRSCSSVTSCSRILMSSARSSWISPVATSVCTCFRNRSRSHTALVMSTVPLH